MMLFTTYALFLEMLFGQNNQHLQGLNAVRGQLMAMAQIRKVLTPMYFANVVWAVLDDGVRHFNECMPFDDLQGITSQMQVVWPRTDLHNFAKMMRGNQNVALLTLPTEWEYAISTPTFEKAASAGGGGGWRQNPRPAGQEPHHGKRRRRRRQRGRKGWNTHLP